jgi:very-short-patch-repair endonuclease
MKPYNQKLIINSRKLRSEMTDAEVLLWKKLRFKQVRGLQFYRQKPLLAFIVDFYCPKAKLVIELDGNQHFEEAHRAADVERDAALEGLGLRVLRFDNRQVLTETEAVMAVIDDAVSEVIGLREV